MNRKHNDHRQGTYVLGQHRPPPGAPPVATTQVEDRLILAGEHKRLCPPNAETLHKPPSAKQLDHYDGNSQPALKAVKEQLSRGGEDRHYCTFVTFVFFVTT